MTTVTQATTQTATAAPTCKDPARRGFSVPCLRCGEMGTVRVFLDACTMEDEAETNFSCGGCEAEWSMQDVRDVLKAWGPALAWLESAPVLEE